MNAERMMLWINALRSGEYPQTHGIMCDDDGFCCLGVMCDVYSKETGQGEWVDGRGKYKEFDLNGVIAKASPQLKVLSWFDFDIPSEVCFVMGMNDDDRLPFDTIADHLEQLLFVQENK